MKMTIQKLNTVVPYACALLLGALSGCSGADPATTAQCPPGQVALGDEVCAPLCSTTDDCATGFSCIRGACQASDAAPIITSVDGDGSIDGKPGHAQHHFATALVITGENLEAIAVNLTGEGMNLPNLNVRSGATSTRALVDLPQALSPGTYTLEVVNQAGSVSSEFTILQGEPGLNGVCDASACGAQALPGTGRVTMLTVTGVANPTAVDQSITLNGEELIDSPGDGLFLGVLRRSDHQPSDDPDHNVVYNVSDQVQRNAFLLEIETLTPSSIVIIASRGDVSGALHTETAGLYLSASLMKVGAGSDLATLKAGESFTLVGVPGIGPGNGLLRVSSLGVSQVSTALVDGDLLSVSGGAREPSAPVGSIVAFHPDATDPPLPIPEGWQACDGSSISASAAYAPGGIGAGLTAGSLTTPDLNGAVGSGLKGRFLRGHTDSGMTEAAALESHLHSSGTLAAQEFGQALAVTNATKSGGDGDDYHSVLQPKAYFAQLTGTTTKTVAGDTGSTGGTETRPANFSVVWIIRVY